MITEMPAKWSAGARMNRQFSQTAWVVADLDATVRHWANLGVGPFYVFRNFEMGFEYRGTTSSTEVSFALAQAGPMQIELVHQHDDRKSAYRDAFGAGESGMHHVGRIVEDYHAEIALLKAEGYEVVMHGCNVGVLYGYVDTRSAVGCMTEITQPDAAMSELYDDIRLAGQRWDGGNAFIERSLEG